MTLKSLVPGVALAAALAFSTTAHAVVTDQPETFVAGTFSGPAAATTLGDALTVGDSFYAHGFISNMGTEFTHTVNFYTDPGELIGDVTSSRLEVEAYDVVVSGIDDLAISINGKGSTAEAMAGLNSATVSGVVAGSFGTYDLNVALSEVPIPGAALLFGSALAGLGYVRRRRQVATA